jgi:hypothetical protein
MASTGGNSDLMEDNTLRLASTDDDRIQPNHGLVLDNPQPVTRRP